MKNPCATLARGDLHCQANSARTTRFLCVEPIRVATSCDVARPWQVIPRQVNGDFIAQHQPSIGNKIMKPKRSSIRRTVLGALALVSTFTTQLSTGLAATHVWTGAVNGYWATPGNWENNSAPTNAAETDIVLRFPAGPTRVVTTNNIGHLSLNAVILAGDNYLLRSVSGHSLSFSPIFGVNLLISGANNTVSCPIQIGGPCSINVDAGDTFTVANSISGPGSLTKFGHGTLVLAGNGANGFIGGFRVHSGMVRARQIGGVALPGPIHIGAADPSAGGAAITLQANNQIAPYTTVGVDWDGVLYLNGFTNSLGTISLVGGAVNTLSNTTPGLLIVQNEILAAGTPEANPSMGGTIAFNGTRSVNVTNGVLTITAKVVDGQTPGGYTKTGEGQLRFTGNNTFNGAGAVVEGSIRAETATALGSTNGATALLGQETQLFITDGLTIKESLNVSNHNTAVVLEGTNTWLGLVTFVRSKASLSFARSPDTLRTTMMRLGGVITGPGRIGVSVHYAEMFGSEPNSYHLETSVSSVTELRLNKTNAIAIPGDLYFGGTTSNLSRVVALRNEQIADSAWMNFNAGSGPGGQLIVNGVTETIGRVTGEGHFVCTNGTLRLTGFGSFEGPLLGNGLSTIIKSGTNIFTIRGDQSYAGKLIVENGALAVFGRYPAAQFEVYPEGFLCGWGPLANATLQGGTVAPGSSPDYSASGMTITNLTSINGRYRCSLGKAALPEALTDNLRVEKLIGGLTLQLIPHYAGQVSNEFTILTPLASPFPAHTFTGLGEGAIVNTDAGHSFRIAYRGGLSSNEVTLTQLSLPTPAQISSIQKDEQGRMVVTGMGGPGMYYTLLATTNLANPVWEAVHDAIAKPSGAITILDYDPYNHPMRFYRLQCER